MSDDVTWEYLRRHLPDDATLTAIGVEGWELVNVDAGTFVFKRPRPAFRERVTLDQRAAVYAHYEHPGAESHYAAPVAAAPILHPDLSHLLLSTGHTDYFTVCDRGFPVPLGPQRIDLALVDGIPTVMDVLRAVQAQWTIDRIVVASEMADISPDFLASLRDLLGRTPIEQISHLDLKHLGAGGRATVRTGDTTPYANVIVVGG